MKIATIVGARPQFIKASAVSRVFRQNNQEQNSPKIREIIVHTGQHYDYNMSETFFKSLEIPKPDYNLSVGSDSHARMTALMLTGIEKVLEKEKPDWVLVYGDTNSTLAGALTASKLLIPIAHVEAGLRSFNKAMPEEINRILTDHVSELLFTPTDAASRNLENEGIVHGVVKAGDVMFDNYLYFKDIALKQSNIMDQFNLQPGTFSLATIHRQENTNCAERLGAIFSALSQIASPAEKIIIPLHPRTREALNSFSSIIKVSSHLKLIDPVDYFDMICLQLNSKVILTDSGGVQKEAFFAKVPCITLRDETEWIETVEAGVNFLCGANVENILDAFSNANSTDVELSGPIYGKGFAGRSIVQSLVESNQ